MKSVTYEWTVEELDEYGDVVDTNAWEDFGRCMTELDRYPELELDVCLVRNVWTRWGDLQSRTWAYFREDKTEYVPERFDDGTPVPKQFLEEVRAERLRRLEA